MDRSESCSCRSRLVIVHIFGDDYLQNAVSDIFTADIPWVLILHFALSKAPTGGLHTLALKRTSYMNDPFMAVVSKTPSEC
jgi:hypothetical protein